MALQALEKAPSGVNGLDGITGGGFPRGRPTLVCGGAGCGKTLLGIQFLVRGALDHDEPGVYVSFEESPEAVTANVASLGWDLDALVADDMLALEYVRLEPNEIIETGEYSLDGLFIRLAAAIDAVGARRITIDTLEALFIGLKDTATVRSELRRLFRWLTERGLTALITAERGEGTLTRHGIEEYVSDCVILLDHRITDQISTRRLRVVKYRGSSHSSDECPFMIDDGGFVVLPVTMLGLEHPASDERVSTGIDRLDTMLGGDGYYRGSSILVTGTPGSGKTTVATSFIASACARGERGLYFSMEESPEQLIRNMGSVGIDLRPLVEAGTLTIISTRPSAYGNETHLGRVRQAISEHEPTVVALDPLSAFGGTPPERASMLVRLVDYLKTLGVTALGTSLETTPDDQHLGVSSVIDTWLSLTSVASNGEINRGIAVVKSRGMNHSNQVREFVLSDRGVELRDVYTGPNGVLMGTARAVREAEEAEAARLDATRLEHRRRQLELRRAAVEAEIAELELDLRSSELALAARASGEARLAQLRGADEGRA